MSTAADVDGATLRLVMHAAYGADAVILIEQMERRGLSPEVLAFNFRTYVENNPDGDLGVKLGAFISGVSLGFASWMGS